MRLELEDYVIDAYNANVVSDNRITCTVGCFSVPPGAYDVVLENLGGREARLQEAFNVAPICGAGGGAAVLVLGTAMGMLAVFGSSRRCGKN